VTGAKIPCLKYRLYRPEDMPCIHRLWEQETEWGALTQETLERWAANADLPLLIVVAVDENEAVVGQLDLVPTRVLVGEQVVQAYRPMAAILSKSVRYTAPSAASLTHPVVAMFKAGIRLMREHGAALMYMVPNPGWVRALHRVPYLSVGSFPLWSLSLPLKSSMDLGSGFCVGVLDAGDERIDALWHHASRHYRCQIVRDRRGLEWKFTDPDTASILGVERDGELAGLVVSTLRGDRQWLVCDLLTLDTGDAMRATIAAAVNEGHNRCLRTEPHKPLHKVAILATPLMQPVLHHLGFQQDNWSFPLVTASFSDRLCRDDVAPEGWYVSATD
jgi:hypothetical protein